MIRYKCPGCGSKLESPDELGGGFDTCPLCQTSCVVPLTKAQQVTARAENKKRIAATAASNKDRPSGTVTGFCQQPQHASAPVDPPPNTPSTVVPVTQRRWHRRRPATGVKIFLALVILLGIGIYASNYYFLQRPMNQVLAQAGNDGINVRVHCEGYCNPSVLVYDLQAVNPQKSMADVFRVFWQYAQKLQNKQYDTVKLCFCGEERFRISGAVFQRLGQDIVCEDPLQIVRLFPQQVRSAAGMFVFPERKNGPSEKVQAQQMQDFIEFHSQWYARDLARDTGQGLFGSMSDNGMTIQDTSCLTNLANRPKIKILGMKTKRVESTASWCVYQWTLTIENLCDQSLAMTAEIKFIDGQGLTLVSDWAYDLKLQPGEKRKFTGRSQLEPHLKDKVAQAQASVRMQ